MSKLVDFYENHRPHADKLPSILQCLVWRQMKAGWDAGMVDGDRVLFAVPIMNSRERDGWEYELSVVRLDCDVHYTRWRLDSGSEEWGWEPDDADFFVRL